MQVIFLGTGPIKKIPRKGCDCFVCRDAKKKKSRSERTRSSILIEVNKKNILIDCGPDFLEQAKREKIKRIDYILITHAHWDAIGGIAQLGHWLKGGQTIPIFTEKQSWQVIQRKFKNINHLKINFIRPYKSFKLNNFLVTPIRVNHSIQKGFPTLGFKLGSRLAYFSDVGSIPQKSQEYLQNIDTLILDGAMWFNKKIKSHLNVSQAIDLAHKLKVKNLYLTQISHTYPSHRIAQKEIKHYLKQRKIALRAILAYDGLLIRI